MIKMRPLLWGIGSVQWIFWGILHYIFSPSYAYVLFATHASESYQYEVGVMYKYFYETSTLLNEPQPAPTSSPKDIGFMIQLNVQIEPVWANPIEPTEQLIRIKIESPNLSVKARQGPTPNGFVPKGSRLDSYQSYSSILHWKKGKILRIYSSNREQSTLINIKKGIASLLQFEQNNVDERETDASGNCFVSYRIIDKLQLIKTKSDCKTTTLRPNDYHNHTNKVLSAKIESQASISYQFEDRHKILNKVSSIEMHFLRIEARLETGSEVISRQTLVLQGDPEKSETRYKGKSVKEVLDVIFKNEQDSYVEGSLISTPDKKECISCKSLQDLISNFKSALSGDNLASQSSAIAFLRILQKMRETDQETIVKILTNKKHHKILPQLLDITAATQTLASHKAAMSILNFNELTNIGLAERYLLAMSLSTHPAPFLIQDLISLVKRKVKSPKLFETLVLTLASVTNTYKKSNGSNKELVEEVGEYIVQQLEECSQEHCKLTYIRSLKNLREQKYTSVLLKYIEGKERKPAIYAMRALQTMPYEYIDNKVLNRLERVFLELDKQHDSTVKSLAANVIIQHNPDVNLLRRIFKNLSNSGLKEMNTLILSQIRDLMTTDKNMRDKVSEILSAPKYGNYNILSQNGLSTSFSRTLAQDKTANSSFTNILEISGGLLKRSTVDVFVHSTDAKMNLLSIEMFAGGLTMFGADEMAEDDGEEANAGIEITLLNTQLRPFVFFTGQGELMGHVWSGTGSERTTALQGSVLLQDHKQYIPLQNGLTAEMLLTGVVSYDFSGQVQVSLWNRNAHSLVEVAAAVVVQGQTRIDNSVIQTMIEFNAGAQNQLNFVTDLDFSDQIIMCLQMIQPDLEIVENVRKLERIPGSKYMLRKYKKKVIPSAGKTYVMNKKNTELCNQMFR